MKTRWSQFLISDVYNNAGNQNVSVFPVSLVQCGFDTWDIYTLRVSANVAALVFNCVISLIRISKQEYLCFTFWLLVLQMVVRNRKEEGKTLTPSVLMEKIQTKPKWDSSWKGSCREIGHPLPKSKSKPLRKVSDIFLRLKQERKAKCALAILRAE